MNGIVKASTQDYSIHRKSHERETNTTSSSLCIGSKNTAYCPRIQRIKARSVITEACATQM